jgi:hypothetical protein
MGIADFKFPNGESICADWIQAYQQSLGMAFTTPFVVAFFNMIFGSFFLWASKYEQWKNKAEEKTSSIPKIFGFQFANTALLILFTNSWIPETKIPYGFPIFGNGYQDFDVWWY